MKKTLVLVGIFAGAIGAYSQGSVSWGDAQTGYTIEILSPNPASPTVQQSGPTSYDNASTHTIYGGGYIGGVTTGGSTGNGVDVGPTPTAGAGGIDYTANQNFEAGLYLDTSASALATDIKSGLPVATTTVLGGANSGLYNSATLVYTSPTLAVATPVWIAIAAWYTGGSSSINSLAAATAAADPGGYVDATTSVNLGGAPGQPAGLAGLGLTSFSLATTPEPSTIALGVIGASAFLMRLRRKQ